MTHSTGKNDGAVYRARRENRRVGRMAVAVLAQILLMVGGLGVYLLSQLNDGIDTVDISRVGGAAGPDFFGRKPINILAIGSDARATAEDCKAVGDCTEVGSNADVELVIHVSADRSRTTVMSVPRDTVTDLPACTDPATGETVSERRGMINSPLAYGPACQVAAVHRLTGIPIDHFMLIGFTGVAKMSDVIGGIPVCVSDDVYDPYSHLKLAKGSHTLKGAAALQFLRTRHGFSDGGDLGRTVSQHLYMGSMIRTLKSAGTATHPVTLYALADTAAKALTVDTGLGSATKLLSLARELDKVPAGNTTFTTMPTEPDPNSSYHVLISPAAHSLLSAIVNDQPLAASRPADPSGKESGRTNPEDTGSDAGTGMTDTAKGCAQVSTLKTVRIHGTWMNPTAAYAQSPAIPDSSP